MSARAADACIRLLVVEDNPGDARLLQETLSDVAPGGFSYRVVDTLGETLQQIGEYESDLILLDLHLPDAQGLEGLRRLRSFAMDTPIVVMTGLDDDEVGLEAVQAGAQDYLVKGRGDGHVLLRSIRYAIQRAAIAKELRESESRYRDLFEHGADLIFLLDTQGHFLMVNERGRRLLGYTMEELRGRPFADLQLGTLESFDHPTGRPSQLATSELPQFLRGRLRRRDASEVWVEGNASWRLRDGKKEHQRYVLHDVSTRERAQATLEARDRLYRAVVQSFPKGFVVVFDHQLNVRLAEGDILRGEGIDPNSLVGRSVLDLLQPPPEVHLTTRMRRVFGGQAETFQLHWRDHYFNAVLAPVQPQLGAEVRKALLVMADVTPLIRAETALHHSESRARAILEAVPDALITYNRDGRITSLNPAAQRLFGFEKREIEGQPVATLLPLEDRVVTDGRSLPDVFHPDRPLSGLRASLTGQRVDGARFPMMLALNKAGSEEEPVYIALIRDRTQECELERIREELVAAVTHDVKTPLSSIHSFAELLLTKNFTEEQQRRFHRIIYNATVRVANYLESFRLIQQMDVSEPVLRCEPLELAPVVETWADRVRAKWGDAYPITLELPQDLPRVHADPEHLRRILSELLDNAYRFSPGGGAIGIGCATHDNGRVSVWVKDSGMGIPTDAHTKLFRRFYRVDSPEHNRIPGNGLGLAIVKDLVDRHGGEIWVESVPDEGARFTFTLPVAQPVAPTTSAEAPDADTPLVR